MTGTALMILVYALRLSAARGDRPEPAPGPADGSALAARARARRAQRRLLRDLTRHDRFTGRHSERVSQLARAVGRRLALGPQALDALERAAALHDLGKLHVPDAILRKSGPLEPAEWAVVARHPAWGAAMLSEVLEPEALAAVRSHHERFDGGGYPDGLAGPQIPLMARIIGACDAYDAMISARSYQPTRTSAAALGELARCSGTQFDPAIVEALDSAVRAGADLVPQTARAARGRSTRHRVRRAAPAFGA